MRQSSDSQTAQTWTVPAIERRPEPLVAGERAMLEGFLEWNRRSLLLKCVGLTGEQLALQPIPPSTLSLLGLIRHVTDVERNWFRRRFLGQDLPPLYGRPDRPDVAFQELDPSQAPAAVEALLREWEMIREEISGASLDDTFLSERWGEMSLRWIYHHMTAEYAQHTGHADLLRERIDGKTGW